MLAVTTSSPSLSKHTRNPVSSAFNHCKFKHVILRMLDLQTHTPQTDHRRGRTIHMQGVILRSSHSGRRIKVSLDAMGKGRKRREILSERASMCAETHWQRTDSNRRLEQALRLTAGQHFFKKSNLHRILSKANPI